MIEWIVWLGGDVVMLGLLVWLDARRRRAEHEANLAWRIVADQHRRELYADILVGCDIETPHLDRRGAA